MHTQREPRWERSVLNVSASASFEIANVLIVYEYIYVELPGSGYYKDDDVNIQKFQSPYFISTICSHEWYGIVG